MHLWFFVFTVLFKILLSLPKSNILYMMCMHILIYDNASFSDLIIETEKTLLIKLIMSASRVLNGGKMWDVNLRHENENFVAFQFSSTIFRKLWSIYFDKFSLIFYLDIKHLGESCTKEGIESAKLNQCMEIFTQIKHPNES